MAVVFYHQYPLMKRVGLGLLCRRLAHHRSASNFLSFTFSLTRTSEKCRNSGLAVSPISFTHQELTACFRMFARSGLNRPEKLTPLLFPPHRGLRTSLGAFSGPSGPENPNSGGSSGDKDNNKDEQKERMLGLLKTLVGFMLFPMILMVVFGSSTSRSDNRDGLDDSRMTPQSVTWNDFYYNMLLAGEVQEIVVHAGFNRATVILRPDAIYRGQRVLNNVFRLQMPPVEGNENRRPQDSSSGESNDTEIEDRIRTAEAKMGIPPGSGVSINYERRSQRVGLFVSTAFFLALTAALFYAVRGFRGQIAMQNPFSRLTRADFTLVEPAIRTGKGVKFSDVAGLREAKIEVKEFVDYLKNPEKYKVLGAKPPRGALLTGPPGCGKTMLAKAVANESNVPFLSMNGSEFIEMIGGLGAARVRDLFLEARKRAPSIVYIDEIDAIGRKRSGGGMGAGSGGGGGGGGVGEAEQTLNQLLVEMDGITTATQGNVIMLASTNRGDVLDKALLRPGRFDRLISIDLPTVVERKEILEAHMKGVKLDGPITNYSERMATLTPGFSGAELANLVNEAALHAARVNNSLVQRSDLEYAVERVIAGPEKKTNVLSPNERKIVAYHESGHAIVGWMLRHTDALLKVTILPRTSQALGFAQYTPIDKKLYSPEELLDRMCMALGGRVAESMIFNRVTTGASNDLEKVTKMAYAQIKYFGFNDVVGLVSYQEMEGGGGKRPYSKRLQATMDHEARLLIAKAYKLTEEVLSNHRNDLVVMAEALLQKETLNYDDVEKLLGAPPFGKKHLVSPVDFENQLTQQSELHKAQAKEG